MTVTILFTDYNYKSVDLEEEIIKKNIPNVRFIHAQCTTEDEVIEKSKNVDGIINQQAPLTSKVIKNLTNCKVIAKYGVGIDTIDVKTAKEKEIMICNVPDYCINEVSEHAFSLLLAQARRINFLNIKVKEGVWDYRIGRPIFRLEGQTLGLLGIGNIGKKMAQKARGFGLNIVAYDPFVDKEAANFLNIKLMSLEKMLSQSDFVSIHTPLTEETFHMIDRNKIKLMKKNSVLINTSRGGLIHEKALIRALRNKEIAGAALDVLENEPIERNNPLLSMNEVIITPHAAWHSEEAQFEVKTKTAQNVSDALTGKKPQYII